MIKPVDALLDKHEARIRELESQDEVHWKTRRTLLAERDRLAAELAGLRLEHQRVWEEKKALEAALLDVQNQLERGQWFDERSEIIDYIINTVHVSRSASETPIAQSKSQQKRFEAQGVAHVPFAEETSCKHEWQTGVMGVCPDVCMSCGTTRPHGEGIEITVTDYESDRGVAK